MKICAAQTRPITGNLPANLVAHTRIVQQAVSLGADTVVFPELSLTGYEPGLANALAINPADARLEGLRAIADARRVTIAVGAPTRSAAGVHISMLIIEPGAPVRVYSKQHLHADEEPYFVRGPGGVGAIGRASIAPAICYELSVPEHAANAHRAGASVYVASVAKFASGIASACTRLSAIAAQYSMTVMMANCVGRCDGQQCVGRTSAWDDTGVLAGQLGDAEEGLLVFDTELRSACFQGLRRTLSPR